MKTSRARALPIAAGIVLFCGYATLLLAQGPPTELKDWQTSLSRFIEHVDSAPNPSTEFGKASPCQPPPVCYLNPPLREDLVSFKIMTANGHCEGEGADEVFGPLVQFEGNFTRVSASLADQSRQQEQEYQVVMSYEATSPTPIIYLSTTEAGLASWQRLSPGAQVRFQAELNCLTRMESPAGKVLGYTLTLREAKVLP